MSKPVPASHRRTPADAPGAATMTRRDWLAGAISTGAISARVISAGAAGLAALCPPSQALAAPRPLPSVREVPRRWRIGYAESMPYGNYAATLAAILGELERMGWTGPLTGLPYRPGQTDTAGLWSWLSARAGSPVLDFVPDAHATNLTAEGAAALVRRLQDPGDIDLMIVMGTVAGVALATDAHRVPVLAFSCTNPIAAGIVESETDTGRDHVWAHLDPRRFQRQLSIFHRTFRFQRLGIAYDDSPTGRAIASLPDIEASAERLGFALVRRHVRAPIDHLDQYRYEVELTDAWEALSREAEAVYITYGRWPLDRFSQLVRPFLKRRVPTFSQLGPEEVERGALMSIARADMAGIGHFGAATLARVMTGEPLRHLPQVYFDTPSIAWNAATAAAIGYRIPFPALLAADSLHGVL
ncbi:ABC-type uncharacterized transport system substrate-binding protein [Azospirillum brasilense]|uniref:ABC-type uncharacterized transport system substrate-binding protein n=1 Tax=Azospirillum brasilense TaxID=192 RepID=A0A560CLH0_AZOBR|nr:ABC transporter substrate binding protein [Azospirillum brasilense]TWA85713.1 ABC-type uncharacterized transport system substrate-binding protein [Azospirillum brasilense]